MLEGFFDNDWKARSPGLLKKQSQTEFADYDELIHPFNTPVQLERSEERRIQRGEMWLNRAKETLVYREMWTSRGFAAASMRTLDSYGSFRRRSAKFPNI